MDLDQQVEGDVDRDYCVRVTLAYLAQLDAKKETNGTQHVRE